MMKVTILPISTEEETPSYLALAGDKQSFGKTAGEALDALTTQIGAAQTGTMIILQNMQPDMYFSDKEQARLNELMAQWRGALDSGASLPQSAQDDLESLIEAELLASAERTKSIINELNE